MMTTIYVYEADHWCKNCFLTGGFPLEEGETPHDYSHYAELNETDTPSHCARCEELLPFKLTGDGYQYAAEAIIDVMCAPRPRPDIVLQWWNMYRGSELNEAIEESIDNQLNYLAKKENQ